ncbi:MoxR-like ATPase [Ereboglobus sp. PH5-10]|uniref:AAA family ATPase n=1 Tax=Ereboglobus sp. PH5-10 TaxID=2940629 RepID=UPI0024059E30|nr:AAA family ATPase [Ereboglobus sp. PH5-10]MDF9826444.1 MoxR-like ATPase [Ereboglobus sp. PH5-10]
MTPSTPTLPNDAELASASASINRLVIALDGVLYGQHELIELVVAGVLARGHILLEGLPGLGKTELVKGLARTLGLDARRVQFTPDLLPGDITGNPILQEVDGRRAFVFQRGPIFANILLADEINRASPKTQSALLEAMQERRVSAGGETHTLPDPFFVLATQNPIELEGTYPLPEAQLDRFLFKIEVRRNSAEVLQRIVLNREIGVEPRVEPVLAREEFTALLGMARRIHMPDTVANYIARMVTATHPGESAASAGVRYGASPRAALALASAAKARGLRHGRGHASFEDVQAVARPVLAHRVLLEHSARLDGATPAGVVEKLLAEIPAQAKPLPTSLAAAKIK